MATGRIRLPKKDRRLDAMLSEIRSYRGARTGAHDDLVKALGLACLFDPTASRILLRSEPIQIGRPF